MTDPPHGSVFQLTKDTPYCTVMGELCGVYCEYFIEIQLYYNITLQYFSSTCPICIPHELFSVVDSFYLAVTDNPHACKTSMTMK